jgi:hypothetical protein
VAAVPFLVPFAFLETGYLFYYTVFARRHAEYLERTINERLGRDVLVAHRLEAAYFYPPDKPKIAGLSLGNPLGMMSAATLGYTGGAFLLWVVGLVASSDLVARIRTEEALYTGQLSMGMYDLLGILVPVQLIWTLAIAGHLVFASLTRRDETKLIAELDRSYGPPDRPAA